MLFKEQRADVWRIDLRIDDRKRFFGKLNRDLFDGLFLSETDADNKIKIALRESTQQRLESVVIRGLDVLQENPKFVLRLGRSAEG